jgi:hypothetical protein
MAGKQHWEKPSSSSWNSGGHIRGSAEQCSFHLLCGLSCYGSSYYTITKMSRLSVISTFRQLMLPGKHCLLTKFSYQIHVIFSDVAIWLISFIHFILPAIFVFHWWIKLRELISSISSSCMSLQVLYGMYVSSVCYDSELDPMNDTVSESRGIVFLSFFPLEIWMESIYSCSHTFFFLIW